MRLGRSTYAVIAPISGEEGTHQRTVRSESRGTARLTFALGDRLDSGLNREGDAADSDTAHDLDGSEVTGRRAGSTVADHETEGKDLDAEAKDDDDFEVTNVSNSDTHDGGGERAGEARERSDALGRQGGLVRGDKNVGVAVNSQLSVTGRVRAA